MSSLKPLEQRLRRRLLKGPTSRSCGSSSFQRRPSQAPEIQSRLNHPTRRPSQASVMQSRLNQPKRRPSQDSDESATQGPVTREEPIDEGLSRAPWRRVSHSRDFPSLLPADQARRSRPPSRSRTPRRSGGRSMSSHQSSDADKYLIVHAPPPGVRQRWGVVEADAEAQADSRKTCSSFLVATFVIATSATVNDVGNTLSNTRAHIPAVVFEKPRSAVAEFVEHLAANCHLTCGMIGYRLGRGVFLFELQPRTSSISGTSSPVVENDVVFASAKVLVTHGGAEVRIGVLNAPSDTKELPQSVLDAMKRQIQYEGCRILLGRFGDTAKQMAQLCTACGAVGRIPICQLWRTEHQRLITHPSYIFLFGRCNTVSVTQSREAPNLSELIERFHADGMSTPFIESMLTLDKIPQWDSTPAETPLNLGRCKQMPLPLHCWRRSVHELSMSIGTARTGQGAKQKGRGKGTQSRSTQWNVKARSRVARS